MAVLSDYISGTRRLLHDPNGSMWSNADLTSYINESRRRLAADTKCLRQQVTGLTLTQGTESYDLAAWVPTYGTRISDLMGINLYFGTLRYALLYQPWTRFNALLRQWQSYQQRPTHYTRVGANTIYVGPNPNATYTVDLDVSIFPTDMTSDSDLETIPLAYTDVVKYWAAYLAKFQEQAIGEAKIFKDEYRAQLMMSTRAFMTRVIPDPYAY